MKRECILTVQLKSNVVDQNNVDWNQNVSYLHVIVGHHQADLLFYPDSFITHLVRTSGVMTRCAIDVKRYRPFFDDFILFLDDVDKSINRQIGLKGCEQRTEQLMWLDRLDIQAWLNIRWNSEPKRMLESNICVRSSMIHREREKKKEKQTWRFKEWTEFIKISTTLNFQFKESL